MPIKKKSRLQWLGEGETWFLTPHIDIELVRKSINLHYFVRTYSEYFITAPKLFNGPVLLSNYLSIITFSAQAPLRRRRIFQGREDQTKFKVLGFLF